MRRWIIVTLLLFSVIDLSSQSNSDKFVSGNEAKNEDILFYNIDGFEVPGEWEVKFSKFRSATWKLGEAKERLPDSGWLRWLTADDNKPNFERKNLVPPDVYRNSLLTDEKSVLTVRGDWDSKGHNWLALLPTSRRMSKDNIASEDINHPRYKTEKLPPDNYILLGGQTTDLFCYVWGMGYNYKIEAHVQDYQSNSYVLPGGYINFYGWRIVSFTVPKYVKQTSKILPRVRPIRFIEFKIVAALDETNKGFYTYLDYLHGRTDIYLKPFFGSQLGNADSVYWSEDESNN